jgi:hypothetical protein
MVGGKKLSFPPQLLINHVFPFLPLCDIYRLVISYPELGKKIRQVNSPKYPLGAYEIQDVTLMQGADILGTVHKVTTFCCCFKFHE